MHDRGEGAARGAAARTNRVAPVTRRAVAHYLQALDVQRKANQIVAILGSKTPNIQNLAVGGVANAINLDNPATLNMEKLYKVKDLLDEVTGFITQVYLPAAAPRRHPSGSRPGAAPWRTRAAESGSPLPPPARYPTCVRPPR